ncbi:MAG: 2-amino-4-hydroxy-6-hydroxymethyldihydropteridine diphosphokinase [Candidatus Omnitrophota bacterium]
MNTVIIAVGSNIDPDRNIPRAKDALEKCGEIIKQSAWIKTPPIGITDQPDFINGAVLLLSALTQPELRFRLKMIEDRLGRDRSQPKYGPRPIDLDIVVWNNAVIDKDVYERGFLKTAVRELIPDILPE